MYLTVDRNAVLGRVCQRDSWSSTSTTDNVVATRKIDAAIFGKLTIFGQTPFPLESFLVLLRFLLLSDLGFLCGSFTLRREEY